MSITQKYFTCLIWFNTDGSLAIIFVIIDSKTKSLKSYQEQQVLREIVVQIFDCFTLRPSKQLKFNSKTQGFN